MQDIRTTLTYLYDLQFFGIKFGLENTRALLQFVGNPHKKFPVIHVAAPCPKPLRTKTSNSFAI